MGGLLLFQQLSAVVNIALNQSVKLVSLFLMLLKGSKWESQLHIYPLEKSSKSFITVRQLFTAMTEYWNDDLGIMLNGQIWITIWINSPYFSRERFFIRLLTTKFQISLAWKWIVVLHTLPKAGESGWSLQVLWRYPGRRGFWINLFLKPNKEPFNDPY